MTEIKQVKVDNWGVYFLQRLKHFFNRTDYCDLTLQFQDNAQLKVHRLVLSACTEYFELLERTCEMYEDCLVMPDDLQADVVVPIVNFMYTGNLEFRLDLLEKLYQTSQILNMPVLTKLLESHRMAIKANTHNYSAVKRFTKISESSKLVKTTTSNKRSYSKAFENNCVTYRDKKVYTPIKLVSESVASPAYSPSPSQLDSTTPNKKSVIVDPRPTRYELPEELDNDNIFDNSFCNISYTCKPLMVHPEAVKSYSAKRTGIFSEPSSSKKLLPGTSTVDIVECKRIAREDNIFEDNIPEHSLNEDLDIFHPTYNNETSKDPSQLFDQILDDGPKVTIETKDSKAASNLDHAKIISEVLKKYPHLVKSNKNIKLKILNTPTKGKKQLKSSPTYMKEIEKIKPKLKVEEPDYTYETDVIDSQQAAKLIAMGAENTKGPWICLICGTPGKALHFTSYYKFRRHLVEVHNEKPVANICEYCGLRSLKRNYLLHHLYSQHGVDPPPQYHFPKCNRCNYIALTEGLLVKHKMTHKEIKSFRCNVCAAPFSTTKQLLQHIQVTGHKYTAERKGNLQCIYCLKSFLRDGNLYAHLKTYHKKEAKNDGVLDDSDDDKPTPDIPRVIKPDRESKFHHIKFEASPSCDNDFEDVDMQQYQIQQRHDGEIQVSPRKQINPLSNTKQKILNPGFGAPKPAPQKPKSVRKPPDPSNFLEDISMPSPPANDSHTEDEIVLIDNVEYIMRNNQLIPRKGKSGGDQYIISDMMDSASLQTVQPTTSVDYTDVHNSKILEEEQPSIIMKKTTNINQPIQIVVSNEEEYKALMSSNHPILFDNGDANKTLTVLTGTHNATIESATINLNNPQSNDMMIIQEDYPLNVTEAVTDNSNIVVVYSHPVDDQNKQFQILTTGGIGSQFVQSSAIITQNYETVTTSAPAMNAHVLESQPDTTWQDTVQTADMQQMPMNQQPELHNVEDKPLQDETSNVLNELPDVHLGPEPHTIPQETQINSASLELNALSTEHTQAIPEIQEESHNLPETPIENLSESVVQGEESAAVLEQIRPMEIVHENGESIPDVLTTNINQEIAGHDDLPMETESIAEHSSAEIIPQNEQAIDSLSVSENAAITENVNLHNAVDEQQPLPESQAYDDIVEINHGTSKGNSPTYIKEAEVKIQNLTSEWSEDEYDVPENVTTTTKQVDNAEIVPQPEHTEKLDNTTEDIQKEVQNHVTPTIEPMPEIETEECENLIPDNTMSSQCEPPLVLENVTITPIQDNPQTPHKISSLLNDWEDNDSQEENNGDDRTVENKIAEVEPIVQEDVTISVLEPKTDNIKSLVSDWDDDEDEIKN